MTFRLVPPGNLAQPSNAPLLGPGQVVPPTLDAGEILAAVPEDMAALAGRAASFVKTTSNKASELAAQHGPTVKQVAMEFSQSASDYAKKTALSAAEVAKTGHERLSDPQFKQQGTRQLRRVGAIAGGALAVLIGISWLYAKHQATIIAHNQIDSFLNGSGLASYITYQSVSASPFGSATLRGVAIESGNGTKMDVRSLSISNITKSDGQVTGGTITVTGFDIPALQFLRADTGSGDSISTNALFANFLTFGYIDVTGNAIFSVHPGDMANTYRIESSGNIRDAGTWRLSVGLGNVPSTLSSGISQLSATSSMTALLSAIPTFESFANINLVGMKLTINDAQFHDRSASLTLQATPSDRRVFVFWPVNRVRLVQNGVSSDTANQIVKAFYGWQNDGGTLRISTHLNQPLPLMTMSNSDNPLLNGFLGSDDIPQPTVSSLEDFFAKTNAQVSF